jgi:ABC-type lipoprotein export system ATPase subunit
MPENYIYAEELFKIYKTDELEVVALRGLDLQVVKGEMMAIVGASGSGKSTFLNILAGLDTPSAGQITVGNRDLLRMKDEDLVDYRRREVGFIWQQTGRNLIPYLTALQNIEAPMILEGVKRRIAKARAQELLTAVGLSDKARRRPNELSGGEQQRVAIGVALANEPPLLLADEPTGELDSATADEVFRVLREINRSTEVTVVIVTHDREITSRVDRVVAMRDGKASTELVRNSESSGVDELAVVDRSGRLQIPREYLDEANIQRRARIDLTDGKVTIKGE